MLDKKFGRDVFTDDVMYTVFKDDDGNNSFFIDSKYKITRISKPFVSVLTLFSWLWGIFDSGWGIPGRRQVKEEASHQESGPRPRSHLVCSQNFERIETPQMSRQPRKCNFPQTSLLRLGYPDLWYGAPHLSQECPRSLHSEWLHGARPWKSPWLLARQEGLAVLWPDQVHYVPDSERTWVCSSSWSHSQRHQASKHIGIQEFGCQDLWLWACYHQELNHQQRLQPYLLRTDKMVQGSRDSPRL